MANDKTKGEKLRERELESARQRLSTLRRSRGVASTIATQERRVERAVQALARARQFRETGSPFGAGGLPAPEPKEESTGQEAVREAVRRRRARERVARQASGG